jgi:hypothetical protein
VLGCNPLDILLQGPETTAVMTTHIIACNTLYNEFDVMVLHSTSVLAELVQVTSECGAGTIHTPGTRFSHHPSVIQNRRDTGKLHLDTHFEQIIQALTINNLATSQNSAARHVPRFVLWPFASHPLFKSASKISLIKICDRGTYPTRRFHVSSQG